MLQNTGRKPNRADFLRLMRPAYHSAFTTETIISSFRKIEMYSLTPDAVADDAIATSNITNRHVVPDEVTPEEREGAANVKILVVPAVEGNKDRGSNKWGGRAKYLTLVKGDATKNPEVKFIFNLLFVSRKQEHYDMLFLVRSY